MHSTVLIASSEFPPGPGGIGNHAYCLADGLCREGNSVHVVAPSLNGSIDLQFDTSLSFSVARVPTGHPWKKARLVIKTITRLAKGERLVVIASGLVMLVICGWYSVLFGRKGIRYILVAHGVDVNPSSFFLRVLVYVGLKGFDLIVPVSTYTAEKIRGVSKNRLRVINNGFDPARFGQDITADKGLRKGYPSLITVGSVTYRKGQINVIKALPVILKTYPDTHYHMIGIEKEKLSLQQLAKELGVDQNITFHGPLGDRQLKAQMSAADIFVMLSNHDPSGDFEGFGIAVLEANFVGLPAIGARESGLRDAIFSGYSGLLIQHDNPDELLDAIKRILIDYDRYAANAREHAANYVWEKVIKQYVDVITEIRCGDAG